MEKGKPQDGIVSRYINRPISRSLTLVLLKFPITPTGWTLLILIFPIAGALAMTHGDYWGFVVGTILYQIHSILDGCDGEIARAKNLQSDRGERIDNWCDHASTFLMVICLGIGMFRNDAVSDPWRMFYVVEGFTTALLLAANEIMLAGFHREDETESSAFDSALYPRHREMIRHSGIPLLGGRVGWWLVQITKRDVSLFAFMLLAIIGWPQWILHLLCVFAIISLALASKTRFIRTR
jgi:1L-myo-inositol 1-phosphate cytidylyltransferase / CDP-L-myo-inositol myo-inositolphosphotransferase